MPENESEPKAHGIASAKVVSFSRENFLRCPGKKPDMTEKHMEISRNTFWACSLRLNLVLIQAVRRSTKSCSANRNRGRPPSTSSFGD